MTPRKPRVCSLAERIPDAMSDALAAEAERNDEPEIGKLRERMLDPLAPERAAVPLSRPVPISDDRYDGLLSLSVTLCRNSMASGSSSNVSTSPARSRSCSSASCGVA